MAFNRQTSECLGFKCCFSVGVVHFGYQNCLMPKNYQKTAQTMHIKNSTYHVSQTKGIFLFLLFFIQMLTIAKLLTCTVIAL